MSLETSLYTTLSAVCPRVFPDVAPAETALPYVTWQQIGGSVIKLLANEPATKRNARIQINAWAKSRIEANALAMQIEDALVSSSAFIAQPDSALMAHIDDDSDLRGAMQDFSIWADR